MKKFFLFLLIGLESVSSQAQDTNQKIISLISIGNTLSLRQQYPSFPKKEIHPVVDLMVRATMKCAFNKPTEAIEKLDSLLINNASYLGDKLFSFFALYKVEQLDRLGRYKECVDILKQIEPKIAKLMNKSYFQDFYLKKYQAMAKIPPSTILRNPSVSYKIPLVKDSVLQRAGRWFISVKAEGKAGNFILDTGSSLNAVSVDFAKKCNAKILADSIPIQGGKSMAKLGIIDKIYIGGVTYTNVIVHIIDFENISKNLCFQYDGVLGSPFFAAIEKIEVYPQTGIVKFPAETTKKSKDNLASNMSMLYTSINAELYLNNDIRTVLFIDTGADMSWINPDFLEKNRFKMDGFIAAKDSVKDVRIGEGIQKREFLPINKIPITINGEIIRSADFIGWTKNEDAISNPRRFNGGLGNENLKRCKSVSFDFENMIFSIEPR